MSNPNFEKALDFIHEIGIETGFTTLAGNQCFLPGLLVEKGRILIDRDKMYYPGDILHEAAHIALVPSSERSLLDGETIGKRKDAAAEEMAALAWTYAACIHMKIDPHFVFHEDGYKGDGASLVENFEAGRWVGVPILQWLGMTGKPGDAYAFPKMIKWKRD